MAEPLSEGFYEARCVMTGCTVAGHLVASSWEQANARFAAKGWQVDPYLCPTHAHPWTVMPAPPASEA